MKLGDFGARLMSGAKESVFYESWRYCLNFTGVTEYLMQNRLFTRVRQSCAFVAENARHVKINHDFLSAYARSLPVKLAMEAVMDSENHLCGDPEMTLAYFLTLDCINFGSGYFSELNLDPGKTGYFTVASRLKNEVLRRGNCSASWLRQISAAECCEIFGQSADNPSALALMKLFSRALNDFGELLQSRFAGSFVNLINSANHSAAGLAEILCEMPFYQDCCNYAGREILLLKRAQISASDLNFAFSGQGFGFFTDIADLTVFADNLVPHVLLTDGVLLYAKELQEKIAAEIELASGSPEEIELRACCVHAVELLRGSFADDGIALTSQQLDYLLWNQGQERKYELSPVHRTRCVFY